MEKLILVFILLYAALRRLSLSKAEMILLAATLAAPLIYRLLEGVGK